MIRTLTFSTLYPNAAQPQHGIFVETRLRKLLETGEVESRVVAPAPWFPSWASALSPGYAHYAAIPARETRMGIDIVHPRFLVVPKIGMALSPFTLAMSAMRAIREEQRTGYDFDLIDAHYFYPDGVAAAIVAKRLGKPLVITARGSDINEIARFNLQRRLILWAADEAAGIVTVCQALKDELLQIAGPHRPIPEAKIRVLRNGVDLERFRPIDPASARQRLGIRGPAIISVGHLIPRKGHDLVIRALAELPGLDLLVVGRGPEEEALRRLAQGLGLADRVRFCGAVAQEELHVYYSATDILVLASDREGWPNVLLEAMACGTPVAATNVWGSPEVVRTAEAGRLIPQRTAGAIADTVRQLHAALPARTATRTYAEGFNWDSTSRGQISLFSAILGR
jgi:teichuronic acid biosynthesis glycosyltransferase TuaC